jgi:hypothetical protein
VIAPIRPRPVTVVAVIWLYLGPGWAALGLTMLLAMAAMPMSLGFLPWFFLGVGLSGALGTIGAVQLLGLRARGRQLSELASWLAFATIVSFTLNWVHGVLFVTYGWGYSTIGGGIHQRMALSGLLGGTLVAVPFLIMARKLRSETVRLAIRDAEARR